MSDPPCANSQEIDEYLKDLEVEIYVTNLDLDFGDWDKYGAEPLGVYESKISSTLLDEMKTTTEYMDMQLNTVDT